MDSEIRVEPGYAPRGLSRLVEIEKSAFGEVAWDRKKMQHMFGYADVWTAYHGARPVGYLACWNVRGKPEIGSIAVARKYRGRGIASELMRQAERHLRRWGCKEVQLRVRVENPAQVLYFRRGYRATGFRKKSWPGGGNILVMTKSLGAKYASRRKR